ncbi:MAG: tetratricopeptide repeat protein [Lentimicrobium sp.]
MKFFLNVILSACILTVYIDFPVQASPDIDSLKRILAGEKNPETRLQALLVYCEQVQGEDTARMNRFCKEMVILATASGNQLVIANALRIAGSQASNNTDYPNAFAFLGRAIELSRKIPSIEGRTALARSLLSLGAVYHGSGDFEPALSLYFESESIYMRLHDNEGLIRVYSSLGDLYDKLRQPQKRKIYNEKAFKLASATNDVTAKCKAYTARANNLANEEQYTEAIELYNKSLLLARNITDLHLVHTILYDLGFTYSRQENYQQALAMYTESLEAARENKSLADEGDALYKVGLMWYYLENLTNAREELFKAMEIADRLKSDILKRNILDVLYSVEESAGDYKQAYIYLNQYVDVIYRIFSQEDQQQVNYLNARFKAAERDHQISELESEKLIQQLKLRRQQTWLAGLLVVLIMAILLVILVFRNFRYKRNISEQHLKIKEQQLSELRKERELLATRSLLQGEESERSRMARDLHDGLGGLLSGVKINLSTMKGNSIITSENAEAFDHAIRLLDTSIGELRRVAHNLMPETLNHYGLKTALNDFVSEIGNTLTTTLNFGFFGEDIRYNKQLELTVYRIAQELVNNALKHAEASAIDLQLIASADRVCIQVVDNGRGFIPGEAGNPGKGLVSIRERVQAFNGRFELESKPGDGTDISIEFPVS